MRADQIEYLSDGHVASDLATLCGYEAGWGVPSPERMTELDAFWPAGVPG